MMRILFVLLALLAFAPAAQAAPAKKAVAARKAGPRDWTRVVVETPSGGVRMGNPAAKVRLVEYGARTCPTCAAFAVQGMPALKAGYIASGAVSFEFRDFPVHGPLDLAPILLGRCGGTARFFPLLEAMMAEQRTLLAREEAVIAKSTTALSEKASGNAVAAFFAEELGYRAFVVQRGVPAVRARACLADAKALNTIITRTNAADARWKIRGTPTFIVNDKVVDAIQWADLEPALRAAGA